MFELTINGQVYKFNFGMGFMREINARLKKPIDGIPNEKENIGLQFRIAGVLSGDVESLVEVLECANKGQDPRITRELLDNHIDNVDTNIDELFDKVIDFLKKTNATRKMTQKIMDVYAKQNQ